MCVCVCVWEREGVGVRGSKVISVSGSVGWCGSVEMSRRSSMCGSRSGRASQNFTMP